MIGPYKIIFTFLFLLLVSCQAQQLNVIGKIPSALKENSAIETLPNSSLLWTIEDSKNDPNLYGFTLEGKIKKKLTLVNCKNSDWEDLTTDTKGNVYIGDFGNNRKERKKFTIYKVSHSNLNAETAPIQKITWTLPKKIKSKDFEAFFLFKNNFYIFSKEPKKAIVLKVPNSSGKHVAELVSEFNLEGKHNLITSADISPNGKTIALLNHNKVWILTDFKKNHFFDGTVYALPFNHSSQKEGICFKNDQTLLITEEFENTSKGNVFSISIN